ncbi:TadE family protein [Microbacterium sp. SORGH_AS_0888]|uniref:TadE family protein n=1 Tax=Microbacterium sp. SORGH_AS_0888 TaxID=3041791 RepID=UPI00277F54A7|nr:TadE family protein [Microbacterium sp. SORGH_AS_0888]MDQ1128246.1 Flp pilus assembly protein TadG [Microbacterium sp. SORGH_AS_0888]
MSLPAPWEDRGSAPVEFVLVGTLLTVLTLGVIQLALGVYVRNVAHDAAVEGAYHAALADTSLDDGADRTRAVIERAIGADYANEVRVDEEEVRGHRMVVVTVRTPMPVIGLIGVPAAWEVTGRAPAESLD